MSEWKAQQDCRSFRNTGIFTGANPDSQGNQNQWAIYADGYRIMTVEEVGPGRPQEVVDAQARLVAAAGTAADKIEQLGYDAQAVIEALPELLDALQRIEGHLDADNCNSYRADDREGAMDTCYFIAKTAIDGIRKQS